MARAQTALDQPRIWGNSDSAAATAEGWDLFENSERGLEIERIDSPEPPAPEEPPFADDWAAIGHVYGRAQEGSQLHQRALALTLSKMPGFSPELLGLRNHEGALQAIRAIQVNRNSEPDEIADALHSAVEIATTALAVSAVRNPPLYADPDALIEKLSDLYDEWLDDDDYLQHLHESIIASPGVIDSVLENTGGGVMLSTSLHRTADGRLTHIVAGDDNLQAFPAFHPTSAHHSAMALWDLAGEDAHLRIADIDAEDRLDELRGTTP